MRRATLVAAGLVVAGALAIAVFAGGRGTARPDADAQARRIGVGYSSEIVERGRAVAVAADCVACHTVSGGQPWAGGLVLETPFGRLAAPNITPDRETGIGAYNEEDFRRVLREGIGPGGKRLYPAMPYPAYTAMTDGDIHALWAYMTTLDPVVNAVDVNQLPFPFNVRLSLVGWNLLNFGRAGPVPDRTDRSPQWNRGRYLVDALGHCGTCHSTKNWLGGDRSGAYLKGGALEGWFAPNIGPDVRVGIGAWSREQLVGYLHDGANHQAIASGPMAEAVGNSTSKMPIDDLSAIAAYLLDDTNERPVSSARPISAEDPQVQRGAAIYKDTCAACHDDRGEGAAGLFPKLAGHPSLQQADATNLIRVVLLGSRAGATPTRPTAPAMPPLGWRLDDDEAAAVITYVRNTWGNAAPAVTAQQVAKMRDALDGKS